MEPDARAEAEAEVRAHCSAGDLDGATTRALQVYGREIFSFLCGLARNESDASDAFSVLTEELWRSIGNFAWESTLRTWIYTLARRALSKGIRRKRRDRLVLEAPRAVSEVAEAVRTETLTYLRTETKSRVRALRDALSEDDRMLLVLRVDRGLAWDELARVMHEDELDAVARKREAARLRKRFQLVKEQLRTMAREQGLITAK